MLVLYAILLWCLDDLWVQCFFSCKFVDIKNGALNV